MKELSNLVFCQKDRAFPNKRHNNKTELYYIFASELQINLFDLCEYLFIDATFKTAPRGFYQVLNIIGFITITGYSFPLMTIPMTSKTFEIYFDIFTSIKKIFGEKLKNKELKKVKIVTNFEEALRRAIKIVFPDSSLDGCYFHFTKILWSKAKDLG